MKINIQERRHILQLCFKMIDFETEMLLKETAGDSGKLLLSTMLTMAKNTHTFEDLATDFFQNLSSLKVQSIDISMVNEDSSYTEETLLKDIIDSHSWADVAKKVLAESSLINKKHKAVHETFVNALTKTLNHLMEKKLESESQASSENSYYFDFSQHKQKKFDRMIEKYLCQLFKDNSEGFWLLYDFCRLLDSIEKQEGNNVQRKAVTVYAAPCIAQALGLKEKLSSDIKHECHFMPMILDSVLKHMMSEPNQLDFINQMVSLSNELTLSPNSSRKPLRSRSRSQDKNTKDSQQLNDALSAVTDELSQLHIDTHEQTSPKSKHKAKFSSPQPQRKTRNPVKRTMSVPGGLSFRSNRKPQ